METIVIGHRNPDMDSICSAVAYAALKEKLGEKNVRPARAGALNERITFVLEKFGVPQPDFLPDTTPRVRDAMIKDCIAAHPDHPVAEALAVMSARGLRALPVVDNDNRFLGVISENKLLGLVLPSRERASHARVVRATLSNIVDTFGGKALTGPLSEEDVEYTLLVAAMDADTFAGRLATMDPARTVLFVGDRENVHHAAIEAGVKAIVIACNTASAAMLRDARERYSIPVIEVIQPAVKRAVSATRSGQVGVIGTQTTIDSKAYEDAFAAAPQLKLTAVACPDFVSFVERGETSGPAVTESALKYLQPLKDKGIDTLVLGCTHYPLLTGVISYVMGNEVTLVSSAEETAKDLYRVLVEKNLLRSSSAKAKYQFISSGNPDSFAKLARRFLGPEVAEVRASEGPWNK